MYPYIDIGIARISSFGIVIAITWLIGLFSLWLIGRREHIKEAPLVDLAFLGSFMGLIGARTWYVLEHWELFGVLDWFRIIARPGLVWTGFVVGFLFAVYLYARRAGWGFLKTVDLVVIPLVVAESIGRIGCFFNGCVVGTLTNLPWGVLIAGYPGARHPLALYESFWLFVAFVMLIERRAKNRYKGFLFWRYGLYVGLIHTILAHWQVDRIYWGYIDSNQAIWALFGLVSFWRLYRKEREQWRDLAIKNLKNLKVALTNTKASYKRKSKS